MELRYDCSMSMQKTMTGSPLCTMLKRRAIRFCPMSSAGMGAKNNCANEVPATDRGPKVISVRFFKPDGESRTIIAAHFHGAIDLLHEHINELQPQRR